MHAAGSCWATKMELARPEIGDLVVLFQSGAYGFTASPTRFLSHAEPVEVLVYQRHTKEF